jgi:hypothetical protein
MNVFIFVSETDQTQAINEAFKTQNINFVVVPVTQLPHHVIVNKIYEKENDSTFLKILSDTTLLNDLRINVLKGLKSEINNIVFSLFPFGKINSKDLDFIIKTFIKIQLEDFIDEIEDFFNKTITFWFVQVNPNIQNYQISRSYTDTINFAKCNYNISDLLKSVFDEDMVDEEDIEEDEPSEPQDEEVSDKEEDKSEANNEQRDLVSSN